MAWTGKWHFFAPLNKRLDSFKKYLCFSSCLYLYRYISTHNCKVCWDSLGENHFWNERTYLQNLISHQGSNNFCKNQIQKCLYKSSKQLFLLYVCYHLTDLSEFYIRKKHLANLLSWNLYHCLLNFCMFLRWE